MRFPDFLVIGAQKAGTTSLFNDLGRHSRVAMPWIKEPASLIDDRVLTRRGRKRYAALFRGCGPDQICGEASTAYTRRPRFEGSAGRARQVLGPDVRLIYVVREPVSRVVSHHHHELANYIDADAASCLNIDEAIHSDPSLLDNTRYAWQLEPWLEAYGPDRLIIIRFEDYVSDRHGQVAAVMRFLGLDPAGVVLDENDVSNRTTGKPIATGRLRTLQHHPVYNLGLRRFVPGWLRGMVMSRLPQTPGRPAPPSIETVEYILEQTADDVRRIGEWMHLDGPVWDVEAVRSRHRRMQESCDSVDHVSVAGSG